MENPATCIVLTHQDIAPRNLILDPFGQLWLIDWAYVGVYPKGFEQSSISKQARNDEFRNQRASTTYRSSCTCHLVGTICSYVTLDMPGLTTGY